MKRGWAVDLNRFRNMFSRFFSGRYGIDNLGSFLMVTCAVFSIANAVFRNDILQIITWAVLLYMFWRTMSRNYVKRMAENRKYLSIRNTVKTELKLFYDKQKFHKTNRFRKCPKCKAIVMLPNKKGKHTVKCPKCTERFDVKI